MTTGVSPVLAGAVVGQALAGIGGGLHHVAVDTLIQQNVPANRLGTGVLTVLAAILPMLMTATGRQPRSRPVPGPSR